MTEFYAAGKHFPLNRTYVMGIPTAASILTPKKRCATR